MFTICPKCALTLVVTAADLRIAQGYVRCGRCLNVFNALARLSEERPGAAPAPAQPPAPLPAAAPSTAEAISADDTGEIEIELDPSILVTSARAPAAPQETPEVDPRVEESPAATPPAATPPAATPSAVAPPEAARETEPERAADAPQAQQTNTEEPPAAAALNLLSRPARTGLALKLGAGALLIALAAQIINHHRDSLAANPALSGPLRSVYSALGVRLAPQWNVHAYEVRQLGASVAGATPGEIVVRASVKNTARAAQPLPLLRVTLQDRFGNRVAARDVPPRDYLPAPVAPGALLAAGGRVDATMVFVDPGPQAVGFEIDACLPLSLYTPARPDRARTGEVACAHGP
jgi:predicted Zn finger-like uncharacterized protein